MNHQESSLKAVVLTFIVTGLLFMLLPGTFLGVWNLVSISSRHQLEGLSAAWLQAHGHAQIYGWIGTFVIGIGFYSLSKMGQLPHFAVRRAWIAYVLWTAGVTLRWAANVTAWRWRIALPVSALMELAAFFTFFATVSRHKANPDAPRKPKEPWMLVVVAGTCGFLFALLMNLFATAQAAWLGITPAVQHTLDQRMLAIPVWVFLVPTVWGFNARWLPVFLGLQAPDGKRLIVAVGLGWVGVLVALTGNSLPTALLLLGSAIVATHALRIFHRPEKPAKTNGVHSSFPVFVRVAY